MNSKSLHLSRELARVEQEHLGPIRDRIVDDLHGELTPTGMMMDKLKNESSERKFNQALLRELIDVFPHLQNGVRSIGIGIKSPKLIPAIQNNVLWLYDGHASQLELNIAPKWNVSKPWQKYFKPYYVVGSKRDTTESNRHNLALIQPSGSDIKVISTSSRSKKAYDELRKTSGSEGIKNKNYRVTDEHIEKMYEHYTGELFADINMPGVVHDQHYLLAQPYALAMNGVANGIRKYGLYVKDDKKETESFKHGPNDEQIDSYKIMENLSRLAIDFGVTSNYGKMISAADKVVQNYRLNGMSVFDIQKLIRENKRIV